MVRGDEGRTRTMSAREQDATATSEAEIGTANHPEPTAMTISRSDWEQLPGDPAWKDEMLELGKVKLD